MRDDNVDIYVMCIQGARLSLSRTYLHKPQKSHLPLEARIVMRCVIVTSGRRNQIVDIRR